MSPRPIRAAGATVVDVGGRTLMPGLIDCHVHVFLPEVNIRALEAVPLTLLTARAAPLMRAMLDRGFTTVRDTGGADWGIREAVERGYLPGPRLFIAGRAIGQTSGHSDPRRRTDLGGGCPTENAMAFTMAIADGVTEVRRAVREQLRQGADHIKIMVSGGVASPYDPLDSLQYSTDEIRAAVEEATAFKRYVCAHSYPANAIARAVECGVRVIEHGNLIDAPTAKLMAKKERVPRPDARRLRRDQPPRGRVRHGSRRASRRTRSCWRRVSARSSSPSGRASAWRSGRTSSASSSPTSRRSSSCGARRSARARSSTRRRSSGPSSSAARASSE